MSQSHNTAIPTLQTILSRSTSKNNHLNIYKHNIQNIIQTGTEKDVATETRIDAHGQKQV